MKSPIIHRNPPTGMLLPKLLPGRLVRRYKRFLADVVLENGKTVTAHCPNTGSMKACSEPGRKVYLSYHDNPRRKLKYTWEFIQMPSSLVGVNTLLPNRLVFQAIQSGQLASFTQYEEIISEVRVGKSHRLDLMLSKKGQAPCYIEIKNCSLVENGIACFPDAVTVRGQKHLQALRQLNADGCRTGMFFLVHRMDAKIFTPADHIDPAYGNELRQAHQEGVEIIVWDVAIDLEKERIRLRRQIPFQLSPSG